MTVAARMPAAAHTALLFINLHIPILIYIILPLPGRAESHIPVENKWAGTLI
jgi:hypothetical protein